ncbi:MAG: hypothetical protein RIG26_09435 [Thalassospira sp.]|uniref:hypothetical protein n=1 Tax=Thalassospira sp. TaxID=1912094 RepID=UPI0032EF6709
MSFSVTHAEITRRCAKLAHQIADNLADRQSDDGNFLLPDFYAKAFAANLWARTDRNTYRINIDRALRALTHQPQDKSYHREFIEYALLDMPGLSLQKRLEILRSSPNQCPDVANWQILGLINRQSRANGIWDKAVGIAHYHFIRSRYWRSPVFLDRPRCFSAQYHAFCAALLADSQNRPQQKMAKPATRLIADMTGSHGYANLLGRGAGQSFGAVCALFTLLKYGATDQAYAILYHLEDAFDKCGALPLNLLAPYLLPPNPGTINPGPANPKTPGWYSYNRHDDYLAFAGYWLLKAASLPSSKTAVALSEKPNQSSQVFLFSSRHYHAQMALTGAQCFDYTPAPVIVSGHGEKACLLLPPTGGEQDSPSLYGPSTAPLPALDGGDVALFISAKRRSSNQVDIAFELGSITGQRSILFSDNEITIKDQIPNTLPKIPDLFRILIDGNLDLRQISDTEFTVPKIGVTITSDRPLSLDNDEAFSVAGAATRITAQGSNCATLKLRWEDQE